MTTIDPQPLADEAITIANNAVNQKFGTRNWSTDSAAGLHWAVVFEASLRALLADARSNAQ